MHPAKAWRKKICAAENQTETANTLMGVLNMRERKMYNETL